jgi:hypothetical protein
VDEGGAHVGLPLLLLGRQARRVLDLLDDFAQSAALEVVLERRDVPLVILTHEFLLSLQHVGAVLYTLELGKENTTNTTNSTNSTTTTTQQQQQH